MEIFIIGATGFVGRAVARHLARAGHHITGLARTEAAAAALKADGITPVAGDLGARLPETIAAARLADTVVYAAAADPAQETATLDDLIQALADSGKTLVFLSGTGVFLQRTAGSWSEAGFAEDDPFTVEPLAAARKAAEEKPRRSRGEGAGRRLTRHAHDGHPLDDVTRLFTLALDKGTSGALYHAVAGETPNRWLAERVADDLGCGTRGVDEAEAAEIWGEFGALIMASSSRCRAPRTRRQLGWEPHHSDMLTMVGEPRLRELAATRP
ncbi:NAD(P)H-binding protein [Streptomyces iranensis]|uniref:NAD(P)H-binding protein n=1 Tax=Streptomyces iranensis TaxID=576784 RepID=UPI0039B7546B